MAVIPISLSVDVSPLERAIPLIAAFGRRTVQEQSVTSLTFIAFRAQKLTDPASIGRIDSDLEVEVRGYTAKGRPSKAKRPAEKRVTPARGVRVPIGVLIIMERMNPNSPYSRLTGNRWPIMGMPTGTGSGPARQQFIARELTRMTLSRHSSTHFLQTGWTPAIRAGLASEYYRYNPAFGTKRAASAIPNGRNTLSPDALGSMVIDISGDACVVTATNDVGESGNPVLAAKHRAALIEFGARPLQQAVDEEASTILREVQRRLDEGWAVKFPELL